MTNHTNITSYKPRPLAEGDVRRTCNPAREGARMP